MAEISVTVTVAGVAIARQISKKSFVIGSDARADVVVSGDPGVRGEHVRVIVRRTDGAIIVRAIGAAMTVNRIAADIPVTVAPTDRVRIGERTELAFAPAELAVTRTSRWWDPRDWREARIGPVPIPMPLTNPPPPNWVAPTPEPVAPPEPPELPPEPVPTWNPPAPRPEDDPSSIIPLMPLFPRNPPRPEAYVETPPLPAPRWRAVLADDPTEHDLLAALRAAPDDPAARMVYADWLERAGREAPAAATRGGAASAQLVDETDADWRAIAACAPIQRCEAVACPRRWSLLAAVDGDERSRTCTDCSARVYYGDTEDTLAALGAAGVKYVPDAALAGRAHLVYYKRGNPRRR